MVALLDLLSDNSCVSSSLLISYLYSLGYGDCSGIIFDELIGTGIDLYNCIVYSRFCVSVSTSKTRKEWHLWFYNYKQMEIKINGNASLHHNNR